MKEISCLLFHSASTHIAYECIVYAQKQRGIE